MVLVVVGCGQLAAAVLPYAPVHLGLDLDPLPKFRSLFFFFAFFLLSSCGLIKKAGAQCTRYYAKFAMM